MDDMDDIVVIDWKSIPVASTELTAHHSHATSMPARSRPTAESADEDDRPPSSDCKARPDVGLAEHEGAPVNEKKETDHAPADGPYGELQEDVNEGLEGIEPSIDLQHQQDIEHSISEDQQRTADSLSISEQDNLERSSSSPTSEDESHPPTTRLRGPEPGPPPPPPLPHLIYQNPPLPPPPLPFNYGFGRRLARGPCPPPPPPPPPPPMPYHDSPSSTGIQPPPPPPPPPPPMAMAGPLPARKRRGCPADLETVHSATQLLPIAISLPPLERIVRLSVGGPNRRAALTHHAATPFDLQAHLWLLRYAEPDRWYARPSAADLRRIRALEAAGLADDIPQQLLLSSSKSSGTAIRPGSTDVVRVWAGAAMGVLCCCPHPFGEEHDDDEEDGSAADMHADDRCRRQIESAFLTYYMVTEAPRALAEEDAGFDAYGPFPPPPPRPVGGARGGGGGGGGGGDEKVYRLEKVGSKDACIARAYHNAALHGWSTVFCCVVQGEVDLRDAEPGLDGFERVGGLAGLVRGGKGDGKKVKVFY